MLDVNNVEQVVAKSVIKEQDITADPQRVLIDDVRGAIDRGNAGDALQVMGGRKLDTKMLDFVADENIGTARDANGKKDSGSFSTDERARMHDTNEAKTIAAEYLTLGYDRMRGGQTRVTDQVKNMVLAIPALEVQFNDPALGRPGQENFLVRVVKTERFRKVVEQKVLEVAKPMSENVSALQAEVNGLDREVQSRDGVLTDLSGKERDLDEFKVGKAKDVEIKAAQATITDIETNQLTPLRTAETIAKQNKDQLGTNIASKQAQVTASATAEAAAQQVHATALAAEQPLVQTLTQRQQEQRTAALTKTAVEGQLATSRGNLPIAENNRNTAQQELAQLQAELAGLPAQITAAEGEATTAQGEFDVANRNVQDRLTALQAARKDKKDLEAKSPRTPAIELKITIADQAVGLAEAAHNAAGQEWQTKKSTLDQKKNTLNTLRTQVQLRTQALNGEIATATQKVTAKTREYDAVARLVQNDEQAVTAATDALTEKDRLLQEAQTQLNVQRAGTTEPARATLDQARATRTAYEGELVMLQRQINATDAAYQAAQQARIAKERELQVAKDKLVALQQRKQELEAELTRRGSEKQTAGKEKGEKETLLQRKRQELAQARAKREQEEKDFVARLQNIFEASAESYFGQLVQETQDAVMKRAKELADKEKDDAKRALINLAQKRYFGRVPGKFLFWDAGEKTSVDIAKVRTDYLELQTNGPDSIMKAVLAGPPAVVDINNQGYDDAKITALATENPALLLELRALTAEKVMAFYLMRGGRAGRGGKFDDADILKFGMSDWGAKVIENGLKGSDELQRQVDAIAGRGLLTAGSSMQERWRKLTPAKMMMVALLVLGAGGLLIGKVATGGIV